MFELNFNIFFDEYRIALGHIFRPLNSHDLSSRPIILTRQALSNGTNDAHFRYLWLENINRTF